MIGYLGLGSNVGDRRSHLQAAIHLLTHQGARPPGGPHQMAWPLGGVDVLASSSVYETEPMGEVIDQRAFFNAVLRIETRLSPERLLDVCKEAERARGRTLAGEPGYVRHGPRPLDVDLLLLGEMVYLSPRLSLPHRETGSRRFVLVPLLELDPGLVIPGRGPARAALDSLGDEGEVRPAGPPLAV